MRLLDFQVNYMLYWWFHFKKEIPIKCLFTQWKWTYMLGFGPWRWSALDMGYMDKRPSFLGKDNRYEGQTNLEGQSQWRTRDVEQPCPSCMGSNAIFFEEQRMWWGHQRLSRLTELVVVPLVSYQLKLPTLAFVLVQVVCLKVICNSSTKPILPLIPSHKR